MKDSLDWVVQDDGYGYPCFYNIGTNETVLEDPRFAVVVDDDLEAQRKYVLQELRYALYFCTGKLYSRFCQYSLTHINVN